MSTFHRVNTPLFSKKGLIEEFPELRVWKKCCHACAYRRDQGNIPKVSRCIELQTHKNNDPFFCVHQAHYGDGKISFFIRFICAGWYSMYLRSKRNELG